MKQNALVMPAHVAKLITFTALKLGLTPSALEEDMITCPITYDGGTSLIVVVMCIGRRGWLRQKAFVSVSLIASVPSARTNRVLSTDNITYPTDPHDIRFTVRLGSMIRASAWSVGISEGLGECLDLPGRPLTKRQRVRNRRFGKVRAKVEHVFRVVKCQFGYRKVRYRGIAKNGAQVFALLALANLYLVRRRIASA